MADAHLSQQMGNLERLCEELKSNCGVAVDDSVAEFGGPITILSLIEVQMGSFLVNSDTIKDNILSIDV